MPSGTAELVTSGVGDDSQKPWTERSLDVELMQLAVGTHEALLGRVFGSSRSRYRRGDAQRRLLMPTHEFVEGIEVAIAGPQHELVIVQNRFLCPLLPDGCRIGSSDVAVHTQPLPAMLRE